jgi:hypothetical protein
MEEEVSILVTKLQDLLEWEPLDIEGVPSLLQVFEEVLT